jgi:hypothetical protein
MVTQLNEDLMQKITFDVWEKTNKFQALATRPNSDIGVEEKEILNQLWEMAQWMQTPNAARFRRHWDSMGISLHAPRGCRPRQVTLQ